MPNRNRQAGDRFEHQTRHALEAEGWWCCRAAGSLGPADVVALRAGNTPRLVSCKVSPRPIPPLERWALINAAQVAGAIPLQAYRPKGGWVEFRTVGTEPGGTVVATLKVPARP